MSLGSRRLGTAATSEPGLSTALRHTLPATKQLMGLA